MLCKNCNSNLDDNAAFCSQCGTPIQMEGRQGEPKSMYQSAHQPFMATPEGYSQKSDSKKMNLLPLIIILVVGLIACVAAIGFLLGQKNPVSDTTPLNLTAVQDSNTASSNTSPAPAEVKIEITTPNAVTNVPSSTIQVVPSNNNVSATYSGYLYPSDSQYITSSELSRYSKDEIALIRNEIYARHGYIFQTEAYRNYFSQMSWYSPNKNFTEKWFNSIEKANRDTIVEYETQMGWR